MSASCVVLVFCLSGASLHKDDANKRTKKIRKCSVSQNRGSTHCNVPTVSSACTIPYLLFSLATYLWYIPSIVYFLTKPPHFLYPNTPNHVTIKYWEISKSTWIDIDGGAKYMYRILLVDDEILVRDAIKENIDWKSLDCELAFLLISYLNLKN